MKDDKFRNGPTRSCVRPASHEDTRGKIVGPAAYVTLDFIAKSVKTACESVVGGKVLLILSTSHSISFKSL